MTRDEHSTVDDGAWAARFARLLEELYGLLLRLDALSTRQGPLVDDADTEPLLAVLDDRRAVVAEIDRLNGLIAPCRARWEAASPALPGAVRADLQRRMDAAAAVSEAVVRRDERDTARMRQRRDDLAERLAGVGRARGAAAAYGPRGGGASFQDREA
ncbi:MAG: hypothetical protein ACKVU4_12335 [Phycisphaerales bacterium]